jgi:hypothetical protein
LKHTNDPVRKGVTRNGYADRTACGQGHEYVEGSWKRRKDGIRQCLICQQITDRRAAEKKAARLASDPDYKEAEAAKSRRIHKISYRRRTMKPEEFDKWLSDFEKTEVEVLKKKSKLDYLKLTPAQSEASDRVNFAVDRKNVAPPCRKNPAPYMDYDERTPPSAADAAKLCADCPFIQECLALGLALKAPTGVWGGTVFVDGKPQK